MVTYYWSFVTDNIMATANMCNIIFKIKQRDKKKKKKAGLIMCVFMHGSGSGYAKWGLVPLAEGGAAVWTPSLTQGKAEQEPQGEEEDGAEDPQTCEVILQHADPDTHTKQINQEEVLYFIFAKLRPCRKWPGFHKSHNKILY